MLLSIPCEQRYGAVAMTPQKHKDETLRTLVDITEAALDWARRQQAKMWELRTSTSLARLWQTHGKCQDAYELLTPVYDWL